MSQTQLSKEEALSVLQALVRGESKASKATLNEVKNFLETEITRALKQNRDLSITAAKLQVLGLVTGDNSSLAPSMVKAAEKILTTQYQKNYENIEKLRFERQGGVLNAPSNDGQIPSSKKGPGH